MRMLNRGWVLTVLALGVLLFAPPGTRESCGGEEGGGRDWQVWADGQSWNFKIDEADPYFCALKRNGRFGAYGITLRVQKGGHNVGIDVLHEGVVKHSWMGNHRSVFVIKDKRLYYAAFDWSGTGASVVAVDLVQGQLLWRERCRGIGPLGGHSGYRNLINLNVGKDVVVVRGQESLGRYIEVKRISDGKTLGHRSFKRD